MNRYIASLCFLLLSFSLMGSPAEWMPVSYKGRIRPADAYAQAWLHDLSHSQTLDAPLQFIWKLDASGSEPFQDLPLFWISSAATKESAGLNVRQNRFSYQELRQASVETPEWNLFASLKGQQADTEFQKAFLALQEQNLPPKQIQQMLEREYPVLERLRSAGNLLKALPGRYKTGEWFSLHALNTQVYSPSTNRLEPIGNFTLYSDEDFQTIRSLYRSSQFEGLATYLYHAYERLAGQPYQQAYGKTLVYPTYNQLKAESFYARYPLIGIAIGLYLFAIVWLILQYRGAFTLLVVAFVYHTILLLLRCYILGRPPVTNMMETVLYVPWVAVAASLAMRLFWPNRALLIASSLIASLLLVLLKLTDHTSNLENIQPVLDSQFWLLIHVLMVVGSYGVFILAGVLGHFYLGTFIYKRHETPFMKQMATCILQALYLGTALLIMGTILGGVWAAESWGRFWDWDPKESWAFISSCLYLIWIHAYRFNKISNFGLAMGAIIGLLSISFTWYGVNYILGTGLHSYGFGLGGAGYYALFLLAEGLFLGSAGLLFYREKKASNVFR